MKDNRRGIKLYIEKKNSEIYNKFYLNMKFIKD